MNVEIFLGPDEEDDFRPLTGDDLVSAIAMPRNFDLKLVVDGVTALHFERGRQYSMTGEGFQKLNEFLMALENNNKVDQALNLWGQALVQRREDGSIEIISPTDYKIVRS